MCGWVGLNLPRGCSAIAVGISKAALAGCRRAHGQEHTNTSYIASFFLVGVCVVREHQASWPPTLVVARLVAVLVRSDARRSRTDRCRCCQVVGTACDAR